jgi:hypothetical protein
MNFHVWGPVSLRHNDLQCWRDSDINAILANLQGNDVLQFVVYGDSAYAVLVDSHIAYRFDNATGAFALTNKCMSSCREIIEWDYGDITRYWKGVDYSQGLKLRQMDVIGSTIYL